MRVSGGDIGAQTEVHVTASHRSGTSRASDAPPLALVVDDSESVRSFVSRVLRLEGWSVLEAPDAIAAMALAGSGQIDLLVTDFEMPHVTGVTLAEQLRKADADLPVMLVSGHPDAARSMRKLRGRTAFTAKPFRVAELIAGIGSIVG